MTDHETFLLLAAKQIGEPLSSEEQADLDAHLASCATCRSIAAGMRRDDIRMRAELGAAKVSPRVRRRVLDEAAGRWRIDPRLILPRSGSGGSRDQRAPDRRVANHAKAVGSRHGAFDTTSSNAVVISVASGRHAFCGGGGIVSVAVDIRAVRGGVLRLRHHPAASGYAGSTFR